MTSPADDAAPEGQPAMVLAATDQPFAIVVRPMEDDRTPEGLVTLGSFLDERLIARCAVSPEVADFLITEGVFDEPVRVVLTAREAAPGVQCQLFALVDLLELPDHLEPEAESGGEDEAEPWAGSVPGAGYEQVIRSRAAEEPDPDEPVDDGPEDDEDDEDDPLAEATLDGQAAVLLGHIVRFDKDRKFRDNLAFEAVDILTKIVAGRVSEVVDKVLEDLLG